MVEITLPWPPAKTSPNKSGQGKWREKSEAAKSYKHTCGLECMAQKVKPIAHEGNLFVKVTYHPPTNGRADWDNLAARAKQGFDAVADAIGIDDGRWWPVLSDKGPKVKGGKIVVEIPEQLVNIPHRGTVS